MVAAVLWVVIVHQTGQVQIPVVYTPFSADGNADGGGGGGCSGCGGGGGSQRSPDWSGLGV